MIAIVGGGPSLQGRGLGKWIDSIDLVIRMTVGNRTPKRSKDDYGYKTDCVITTTSHQFRQLENCDLSNCKAIWIQATRYIREALGVNNYHENWIRNHLEYSGPIIWIKNVIKKWLDLYKCECDKNVLHYRHEENRDIRVPWYPSKGTAAILTAMYLEDDTILAAGFDWVLLKAEPEWFTHDWNYENKLIKMAAKETGRKVLALQ